MANKSRFHSSITSHPNHFSVQVVGQGRKSKLTESDQQVSDLVWSERERCDIVSLPRAPMLPCLAACSICAPCPQLPICGQPGSLSF